VTPVLAVGNKVSAEAVVLAAVVLAVVIIVVVIIVVVLVAAGSSKAPFIAVAGTLLIFVVAVQRSIVASSLVALMD
jgi:hypothetical protein